MRFPGLKNGWLSWFDRTHSRWLGHIRERQAELKSASDSQLAARYRTLKAPDYRSNTDADPIDTAFALALESLSRTTGMVAYDVQLLGGLAMAKGYIAEMQTGEGKTLTTMFPITAFAFSGQGVHVATVNEYLAERDYEFLKPALHLLGITCGISRSGESTVLKRLAYDCDVTFATGYEVGFDFLRDQIALRKQNTTRLGATLRRQLADCDGGERLTTQRNFAAVIIDEVDSVLIDEAITPLVLSSGSLGSKADDSVYHAAKVAAGQMELPADFVIKPQQKTVELTAKGESKLSEQFKSTFGSDSMPRLLRPWRQYVESALRAEHIMSRDINYIVRDDQVEIVDEYTGRIFSDRNWRDGLHQAVEAKENVTINEERRTIAKISRQRYFARYGNICGMTGTADGHQRELKSCYGTPVVIIPRRKPLQRTHLPTRYFKTEEEKFLAVVADSIARQEQGQPVLIGTRTIRQSRRLSALFDKQAINHSVLNGVQDEQEATLIARAGQSGTITVATNMAGRGTDIKLTEPSIQSGGLHVIGVERSSSLRIDRQLLGRSGRQGDPGSGQFYVSSEDELLSRFDPALCKKLKGIRSPDGMTSRYFDRRINCIQKRSEATSYQSRQEIMREELWLQSIKKAVA